MGQMVTKGQKNPTYTKNVRDPQISELVVTPRHSRATSAAVTDDQGRFRLRTWRDADGTLAGTHVVCVTKTVPTAAESDNPYPESKNILPARYASPLTSPLRVDVSPAGNNVFRFELEP
jgi:hypothetical protein